MLLDDGGYSKTIIRAGKVGGVLRCVVYWEGDLVMKCTFALDMEFGPLGASVMERLPAGLGDLGVRFCICIELDGKL
jgi:hypothetical protein